MSIVMVIGMHRSGTSCVAGALQEAGLYAGEVSTQDPHNPRGNREHLAIRALNDDVLSASGGAWNQPPRRVVWTGEHERKRDELIVRFAGRSAHWMFKDPRSLLVMPFWRATANDIVPVGCFRDPFRVARSLNARRSMSLSLEHGLALWLAYNRFLLALHRAESFPVLCFDELGEQFREQLGVTVDWLAQRLEGEASLNRDAARAFYDDSLIYSGRADPTSAREMSMTASDLGRDAMELYAELEARRVAQRV